MKRDELIEIGQVKRAHGLNGEVKVNITSFYKQYIPTLDVLVIEKGDEFLPFFVEQWQPAAQEPILKFESVNTKEEATALNGKKIFAIADQLPEIYENEQDQFVGYTVIDQDDMTIGTIEEVLEYPSQLMLRVTSETQELMIPLHPDWVNEVDQENQILYMNLPEGFLDIFQ